MPNETTRRRLKLAVVVSCCYGVVMAAEAGERTVAPAIALDVHDCGRLPQAVLKSAFFELQRIFRHADVEIEWWGCREVMRLADSVPSRRRVVVPLKIWRRESALHRRIDPSTLGLVIAGDSGRAAWVFFDRVDRTAARYALDPAIVLAHVIAHEIGHLLLPPGAHADDGLMRGAWTQQDLLRSVHGGLRFDTGQAERIRESVVSSALSD